MQRCAGAKIACWRSSQIRHVFGGLRRAGSWASSLIAMRSAGGGRPLSTGGITTFLSPASSSSHILSIILLCICSLAKQVGATFRLEACGWFYAAAGRWAANPRLFELYGGEMVLNNCIWCHTSPRSRYFTCCTTSLRQKRVRTWKSPDLSVQSRPRQADVRDSSKLRLQLVFGRWLP